MSILLTAALQILILLGCSVCLELPATRAERISTLLVSAVSDYKRLYDTLSPFLYNNQSLYFQEAHAMLTQESETILHFAERYVEELGLQIDNLTQLTVQDPRGRVVSVPFIPVQYDEIEDFDDYSYHYYDEDSDYYDY